jgi:hypothetical protein
VDNEAAQIAIGDVVEQMRKFLGSTGRPELGEADTKAHFIDPIVRALGWHGIGVVQRESYVTSSQERIDYVMYVAGSRALALEAKSIGTPLADKHAAQLVQYCSVEGIEWAALTNGRDWQIFNTFLHPDIHAKRILRFGLFSAGSGEPSVEPLGLLWLLSRADFPSRIRLWLDDRRLDTALRQILSDGSSRTVLAVVQELKAADVSVRSTAVVRWFHDHLMPFAATVTATDGLRSLPVSTAGPVAPPSLATVINTEAPVRPADANVLPNGSGLPQGGKRYYGIGLSDLLRAGLVTPGTPLKLAAHGEDLASAEVGPNGEIVYHGRAYSSPSDKEFARLLGRVSTNGWTDWYADLPQGRRMLSELRDRLLRSRNSGRP